MNAKKPAEKGTVDWFQQARFRCVDHLRALLSMQIALRDANIIVDSWNSLPVEVSASLHSSCAIVYSRPFTTAETRFGKSKYPIKHIKKSDGFDQELHLHILNLRDRIIAHSDYAIFPSTMYVQLMGDERVRVTLGINVKAMRGILSLNLASRYRAHIAACAASIENHLNSECSILAEEMQKHPEIFDSTNNIPVLSDRVTLTPQLTHFPGPSGPAAEVKDPSFSTEISEYRYVTLTHQIPLLASGTYTLHNNGDPFKITIETTGAGKE